MEETAHERWREARRMARSAAAANLFEEGERLYRAALHAAEALEPTAPHVLTSLRELIRLYDDRIASLQAEGFLLLRRLRPSGLYPRRPPSGATIGHGRNCRGQSRSGGGHWRSSTARPPQGSLST